MNQSSYESTVSQQDASAKKAPLPQVVLVGLSLSAMGVFLFAAAGRLDWMGGWIFVGLVLFSLAAQSLTVRVKNPVLAQERWKERADTKSFDRVYTQIYMAMLPVMTLVAGLDSGRFGWSSLPEWTVPVGVALHVLGQLPVLWSFSTNPHLETTVRVQSDRDHKVINTGPYRFVRHPMYLGLLLMLVGWPLVFGSLWAYLPALVAMAAFIARTAHEDQTLRQELPGYLEYTRQTRYRLVPGLW